ncbi:MAG: leucine-rich repeat protein [Lachnospiraceae bacterium]|nr:leucine-rich repeat protein [Lachnospiraceae bacterium]
MGYRYEKYEENNRYVELPREADGVPLTIIGAKAFLSCRNVESLILPDSLESVEDWAFAHMKGLKEFGISSGAAGRCGSGGAELFAGVPVGRNGRGGFFWKLGTKGMKFLGLAPMHKLFVPAASA